MKDPYDKSGPTDASDRPEESAAPEPTEASADPDPPESDPLDTGPLDSELPGGDLDGRDLADFDLGGDAETSPFDPDADAPGGRGDRPVWLWILLGLLLLATAGAVWWMNRPEEVAPQETPATSTSDAPAPTTETESPEPPFEVPELEESDPVIRGLVQGLSSHPRLASWLATDDLVRRFVGSVVNITEGVSPRSHLQMVAPAEPFSVRREPGSVVPSDRSYARYDTVADVVSSLDVEGTVELYERLEPVIDEAFSELGYPGRSFDDILIEAMDHLLATPIPDGEPELVETVAGYRYADPELESLSSAQKQLLRAGPDNARRILTTLRALRRELGN